MWFPITAACRQAQSDPPGAVGLVWRARRAGNAEPVTLVALALLRRSINGTKLAPSEDDDEEETFGFMEGIRVAIAAMRQRVAEFSYYSPTSSLRRLVLRGTMWTLFGYGAAQTLRFAGNYFGNNRSALDDSPGKASERQAVLFFR